MRIQPYTPSPARRCLLRQVCAALKVLAAGNSFQDVATFSGMSVTTAETSFHLFCNKFARGGDLNFRILNQHASAFHQSRAQKLSSPRNERAQKVLLTKVSDQKLPQNFDFFRNFLIP